VFTPKLHLNLQTFEFFPKKISPHIADVPWRIPAPEFSQTAGDKIGNTQRTPALPNKKQNRKKFTNEKKHTQTNKETQKNITTSNTFEPERIKHKELPMMVRNISMKEL